MPEYRVIVANPEELEKILEDLNLTRDEYGEQIRVDAVTHLLENLPYVTGNMLRSITWQIESDIEAYRIEIYSDEGKIGGFFYPIIVELGSSPHFVPLKTLKRWAELKYNLPPKRATALARRVQKGILKRGNVAHKHFENTAEYIAEKYGGEL